eukprot:6899048-Ditylum_brightwellii.AAC.1
MSICLWIFAPLEWDVAYYLCFDVEDVCTNKDHEYMNGEMGVICGSCGTPCQSFPERDLCKMDYNTKDKENGTEREVDGKWRRC